MNILIDIDKLTEEQAKEVLKNIIDQLDDLDTEDYFGTESWKHFFGFED
jgi:hypothetical protein